MTYRRSEAHHEPGLPYAPRHGERFDPHPLHCPWPCLPHYVPEALCGDALPLGLRRLPRHDWTAPTRGSHRRMAPPEALMRLWGLRP